MRSDFQFHDLAGKTLVITGITRGIGRALLPGLLAQGLNLIAVSRGGEKLLAVRRELGMDESRLHLVECDLADPAAVQAAGRTITGLGRPVDGILHNAAIDPRHRFEKAEPAPWATVWQVNLNAAVTLTQAVLPLLKAVPQGRVIFTGSIVSELGGSYMTAYAASKGALVALTRSLAHELQATGITVNCILPGAIRVEKEAGTIGAEQVLLGWQSVARRLTADDLLGPLCLLLSHAGGGISGQCLTVDGGVLHPLMARESQRSRLEKDGYA